MGAALLHRAPATAPVLALVDEEPVAPGAALDPSALGGGKRGLASGLLNAAAEVGYVLGLAVLVPLAAARTDSRAEGVAHPTAAALVEGFRWAFYAGAALAVLGALAALILIRAKAWGAGEALAPDRGAP